MEGIDLPGVFRLRSVADSRAIREAAQDARDAVVVGSGFIGMEVAASLTQLGLDVTLVSRDSDLFSQLRSPEISEHLVNLYRRHGVDIVRGDEVNAFRGRSSLDTVELHTGDPVAAGPAVIGIGVKPEVSFLDGSGLEIDDGIVVDERFQTNLPMSTRQETLRASSIRSTNVDAGSNIGRTRITRVPRSARFLPAQTAATTRSRPSSPSPSG